MTVRPVLSDPALDERYRRDGYVIVPALTRRQIRELARTFRRFRPPRDAAFHSTIYSSDTEVKRSIDAALRAIVSDTLDALLVDHRILASSFVSKRPGPDGAMRPHQDWTMVDETTSASVNVWCPLSRVDERNGAVALLRGGHSLPYTIRGSNIGSALEAIKPAALDHLDLQPMRPGEVLIHDHRVVHASAPNRSRRTRVAAAFAVVPREVQAVHYIGAADGRVERHAVDEEFFLTYTFGDAELPPSARFERSLEFSNPELTEGDLRAATRPGR